MTDKQTTFKRGDRMTLRLYLQSEAPRLGCGQRLFDVHVGNSHAKLTVRATGKSARVTRAILANLIERAKRHGLVAE